MQDQTKILVHQDTFAKSSLSGSSILNLREAAKLIYCGKIEKIEKRCNYETGDRVCSPSCHSQEGKTIFFGIDDNKVYALDSETGRKKWEKQ